MISFTEYCFCFWVVVFFFWKGGIWFFLELLKGEKEGRDLNNNNTNTNINTHTNTNTNTNTHRRIREKEEEKKKRKEKLTRHILQPQRKSLVISPTRFSNRFITRRKQSHEHKRINQRPRIRDSPALENDAEIRRVPSEEHIHVAHGSVVAHITMAHIAVARVAVVHVGVVHYLFCFGGVSFGGRW